MSSDYWSHSHTTQHISEDKALHTVNIDTQAQLGTSAAAGVDAVSGCGSLHSREGHIISVDRSCPALPQPGNLCEFKQRGWGVCMEFVQSHIYS